MQFSAEQNRALSQVAHWLESSSQQVFRLFGYAGTGKTTLARHFAEGVGGTVLFGAFTGKAAYVLRQKGCLSASTIHSLIYLPKSKSVQRLQQLRERLANTDPKHDMHKRLSKAIKAEEENVARPMFQLNLDSPLQDAKLLIVDEVSMINEQMGKDLESFGCKILVLGDPAQLPPVYGGSYFIDAKPDIMLTDIHRQAKGNPIIELATQIRNGQIPKLGSYGESSVIQRADMNANLVMSSEQLIVGKNVTRRNFNNRIRELHGLTEDHPMSTDRVVCLRNDNEVGLLNGGLWRVQDALLDEDDTGKIDMMLEPEEGGAIKHVNAHLCHFQGEKPDLWAIKQAQEFDYGYALTCHKSQGSQWKSVIVYDERMMRGSDKFKWLYTAVTRASERVHLVQ